MLTERSFKVARGDPETNLRQFLAEHGHAPDELLEHIGEFVTPELVVASGSVVAGYANERSDIDLYVVGEVPETQGVPLVSHELGPLLDVVLLHADQLRADIHQLEVNPLFQRTDRPLAEQWKKARRDIAQSIRLAYGVAVAESAEWATIRASLGTGWLQDRSATFWQLEAWRQLVSARWLRETRPLLASQLVCDATLFALKTITTRAGYLYFSPKWMSADMHALGRSDLLRRYRDALRASSNVASVDARLDAAARLFEDELGWRASDVTIELTYTSGVTAQTVQGSTIISRWETRGARFAEPLPTVPRDGRPIWRGDIADKPSTALQDLFSVGMLWLGVRHAAS